MKASYVAPCLYCEEFVPDTMIASCENGECSNMFGTVEKWANMCYECSASISSSTINAAGNYCFGNDPLLIEALCEQ